MNAVWIVLPILTLLMFELGLTLELKDFRLFRERPYPVAVGLTAQIVLLPALAFALGRLFGLESVFFIGLILIACSPGGSSSNIFSLIAKGDVALSVSLTALSSIITLFTIPVIMQLAISMAGGNTPETAVELPVVRLIIQNILLTLLPIAVGIAVRRYRPDTAERMHRVLSRIAFPSLILLASLFFVQHHTTIIDNFKQLGACIALLILLATSSGVLLSRLMRFTLKEQRTLVIEIGMQNAAQSIAIASSPFIFNNDLIAVPAIVYALLMNVILLAYVWGIKRKDARQTSAFVL